MNFGAGTWDIYDGSGLASRGVVVVTSNYRLGRLGFFAHPVLSQEHPDEPRGNYGLMDQMEVLRWVQRNIRAFGGDPENVTVFGESSGANMIATMLAIPSANGLFHRAILQSPLGIASRAPTLGTQERLGEAFVSQLAVESDTADALRRIDTDALVGSEPETMADLPRSIPMLDGILIMQSFSDAVAKGAIHPVDLMIGTNTKDLYFGVPTLAGLQLSPFNVLPSDYVLESLGDSRAEVLALYPEASSEDLPALAERIQMDCINAFVRYVADQIAASGRASYVYSFDAVPGLLSRFTDDAPHGTELPYVFETPDRVTGLFPTENDLRVASRVADYWTAFAKTGDPNGEDRPRWDPYDIESDPTLIFTNEGAHSQRLIAERTLATLVDVVTRGTPKGP